MADSDHSNKRKTKKRIITLVVLGLGAASILIVAEPFLTARRLPQALAEYQTAGFPLTSGELASPDPSPEIVQATARLKEALTAIAQGPAVNPMALHEQTLKQDIQILESTLAPYQEPLDQITTALDGPGIDYRIPYQDGPELLFPEQEQIADAVTLLNARAVLLDRQGNGQAALKNLQAALTLARTLTQEPQFYAQVVAAFSQTRTYQTAAVIAEESLRQNRPIAPLLSLLQNNPPQQDFLTALKAEIYFSVRHVRFREDPNADPDGTPVDFLARAEYTRTLEHWSKAALLVQTHKDDPLSLGKALDRHNAKLKNSAHALPGSDIGLYEKTAQNLTTGHAQYVVALAYLEALEFKQRTGAFPTTIEDLPTSHIDPFTGNPLKLTSLNDDIRVYSVGFNLQDDGGRNYLEAMAAGISEQGDIVLPLVPPKL